MSASVELAPALDLEQAPAAPTTRTDAGPSPESNGPSAVGQSRELVRLKAAGRRGPALKQTEGAESEGAETEGGESETPEKAPEVPAWPGPVQRKALGPVRVGGLAPALKAAEPGGLAGSIGGAGAPQRKSAADVANEGFKGGGQEVPFRKEMEQSFGTDFSGVRAHTGSAAGQASEQLNAHAYAMGNQVAFKGAPDKATVAHELTHVVQQQGGPARKANDGGIDTSGEAQAEAVEAAVRSGKPASSVLGEVKGGGGVARKADGEAPALEAAGPGSKFGMGMQFSKEGFEKSYEYTIWNKSMSWPIFAGVNFIVDPSVKVSGSIGANWGGDNKGTAQFKLGVGGDVGIGLSGGVPNVAEVYLTGNPGVAGGATMTLGPGSDWNLEAGATVTMAGKIGVKLGGCVDNSFQLFSLELFKITGMYFDKTGFRKDKLAFGWGKDIKPILDAIEVAIEKAKSAGRAVKQAGQKVYNTARDFISWATSW